MSWRHEPIVAVTQVETTPMVHVAEAGEDRGRVVLRLGSAHPNRIAVEAALRVARAYQASLESVYVEDQHIIDLAMHESAMEVSLSGLTRRTLSAAACMRQYAYAAREAERRIAAMARVADIAYAARTLRDTPLHALNRACAERGPWNIIALADAVRPADRDEVLALMDDVSGVTGFLLVAQQVRRAHGPMVIVLEERERLMQLLRTAERLSADTNDQIVILLAGETPGAVADLDHDVRLLLGARSDIRFANGITHGSSAALADQVRRLGGGFIVGHTGGLLLPRNASWIALAQSLECPLFVAR